VPDTQTEESPTSPLNADDIVEKLAQADFLSGLLADPDVKAALLGEIRELGFRPPLHYVVLRLITALVAKSEVAMMMSGMAAAQSNRGSLLAPTPNYDQRTQRERQDYQQELGRFGSDVS
jgi:hypothetical protein